MKLLSTKLIYIIGAVVLSAAVFVGTFFAVSALGGFDDFGNGLVVEVPYSEKEYSGSAQTSETYEIKEGKLKDGHTLKVMSAPQLTYVGTVKNQLVLGVFDQEGNDVTQIYNIEYEYEDFKVIPKKLNLKSESREVLYNKDADPITTTGLYLDGRLIVGEQIQLSTGDFINVSYPSFLDAGIHQNKTEISIVNAENEDVSSYYQVEFEYGNIKIKQFTLKFKTESKQKEYDGEPLSNSKIKIVSGEQEGHYYKAVKDTVKSITDVPLDGKGIENKFDIIVTDEEGTDITHAYLFDGDYGELNILKRPVTLTTFDLEKVYDGQPLSYLAAPTLLENIGYEIKYSGEDVSQTIGIVKEQFVYVIGEEDPENCHASKTYVHLDKEGNVASIPNRLNVKIYSDDTKQVETSNNYDITYVYGNLTILQRGLGEYENGTLIIEKEYDGEKEYSNIIDYGNNIVYGDKIILECISSSPDVGVYGWPVIIDGVVDGQLDLTQFKIENDIVGDVTCCYNLEYLALNVSPKIIVVKSGTDEKEYDGTPLKAEWVDTEGLIEGQTLTINAVYSGSQTEVGESSNTYNIGEIQSNLDLVQITDEQGNSINPNNYIIDFLCGTLTVLPSNGEGGEGEGGGGEGGGGDIDFDDITDDNDMADPVPVFKITTTAAGTFYLKSASAGSYQKNGWADAVDYTVNSQRYFARVLAGKGLFEETAKIEKIAMNTYLAPYYPTVNGTTNYCLYNDPNVIATDHSYAYKGDLPSEYFVNFYDYNYLTSMETLGMIDDSAYYAYAMANYTDVVSSTGIFLEQTIADRGKDLQAWKDVVSNKNYGYDAKIKELIKEVASFIQSLATYDLTAKMDMANNDYDVVKAFINGGKGVCRHFATAGTLIYRMIGIPARYTIGYYATVPETNTPTVITSDKAHAWVEIYLENYGWVPIDVTGGDDNNGGGGGGGEDGGGDEEGEGDNDTIKPVKVYVNVNDEGSIKIKTEDYPGKQVEIFNAYKNVSLIVSGTTTATVKIDENNVKYVALENGDRLYVNISQCTNTGFFSEEMKFSATFIDKDGVDVTGSYRYKGLVLISGNWIIENE